MKKYTEAEIDELVKMANRAERKDALFAMVLGWHRGMALTEGQGRAQSQRRMMGRSFFEAIEYCMTDESVGIKTR